MFLKLTRLLAAPLLAGITAARASGARPGLRLEAPILASPSIETYPEVSHPRDPIKRAVFERINRDRAEEGVPAVAWDEAAARVADVFCARQVAERTRGHFLMDGVPPYARTAFAGVFGMESENSVSWVSSEPTFSDPIEKLAIEGHAEMMREKPPADGHRQTILDPEATHVGVGYSAEHGRFQMAQEFLVRHLSRLSLSSTRSGRARVLFEGRPVGRHTLQFVTIAWEPGPRPLSRQEATSRKAYAYPTATLSYIPEGQRLMRVIGTTSEDRLKIRPDNSFSFEFLPARAGLYTFVFYTTAHPAHPSTPGASAVLWFD